MANPVVHFEVNGRDAHKTQQFCAGLFGWKVDANNPYNYGMVQKDDAGIGGGLSGGDQMPPHAIFYVEVSDLQASLDKVTAMGGKVVMPVTEIPDAATIAVFADHDGNLVGLTKAM